MSSIDKSVLEHFLFNKKDIIMSYDLKIFRNEVREENDSLDFLEKEESLASFTENQTEILRKKLQHYKYELESNNGSFEEYNFKGGKWGISALLSKNCLTFKCSGGSKMGIFEILQTASELAEGDFSLLNLQEGTWENDGEQYKVGESTQKGGEEQSGFGKYYVDLDSLEAQIPKEEKKPWWKFW